jgi:type I restriction enzyme, S subunit
MLPEGWRRVPLEHIAEVRTGLAKGKPTSPDAVSLPYLRVANVQDGHLDLRELKLIEVEHDQVARYSLKSGDILMTEGGDFDKLGRGAVWQAQIEPCLHQNHVFAVRPMASIVDPGYLSSLAASDYGRTYFLSCAKRSTNLASINSSQLKAFPVVLPPLSEQQEISRILSTWAQAIVATEQLLVNRQTQWHALLAETLHVRSANPDGKGAGDNGGYPASVQPGIPNLPPTPDGWHCVPLARHLTEVRRPAPLNADEMYRLVTVKRSRGGVELRETLLGREIKTPSQFYVRTGDFLISKRQIVHGACGIVPPELDGAVVSNEYAVLNTDGQIDLRFLRYLSESRYFQQTCFHSSIGVHVEKMIFKTERWLRWPFNIPPLPIQLRIVEVLNTARREVELIAAQIERLKQEKAALMADLLTGKRRVRLPAAETTP